MSSTVGRRLLGATATATAAVVAFTGTPAQAASDGFATVTNGVVTFSAADGHANELTATISGANLILDDVFPIYAGTGCTAVTGDATKVSCRIGFFRTDMVLEATLYDGNDEFTSVMNAGSRVFGGAGDDRLLTGGRVDYLYGEAGADHLDGGLGSDLLSGGDGGDTVDYQDRTEGVTVLLDIDNIGLPVSGQAGEGDRVLPDTEVVIGTRYDDHLVAGAFTAYVLHGLDGADVLDGGLASRANLFGSAGDDTITGTDGDDIIIAGGGTHHVDGRGGNDLIQGGEGDDELFGGEGDDELRGGAGDDLLDGGPGADTLDGGANGTGTGDVCRAGTGGGTTAGCETVE